MSSKTKPTSSRQQQQHEQPNSPNQAQTRDLRLTDGNSSRTRKNSRWPKPKPNLVNKNAEKQDCDGGFKSSLDFGDVIEKGSVSTSLDTSTVKTSVLGIQDNGKVVEKLISNNKKENDNDPVERLQELSLSIGEAELSEEVFNINNQLQEDELLAMESIYGDNLVILENQNGLRCFQVNIRVEVPDGIALTTKLNSLDSSCSFKVEYLPPIHFTCLLPKSYPSNRAPLFTIYVQWLSSSKISDLCHKLDSIWKNQGGQEVIYPWVEWLQVCSLSHLGFENEIALGPYGLKGDYDRRAVSGNVSLDSDIQSIKSYNNEQHHENFCRSIQECCICFSEYPGSDFVRLSCKHFFCWKCLKTFSGMHVKEGTVFKIQCLELKCDGMIPPGLLKRLLGDEEFERWESLMLQKTLESMKDVVYCPRCETACLEDEDHHAQCSKCYYSFCALCTDKRHVGLACLTPEKQLLLRQARRNSILTEEQQRLGKIDVNNQLMSLKAIYGSTTQCPTCKIAISKTEGCNHMKCHNCWTDFCYRCAQLSGQHNHKGWDEAAETEVRKLELMDDRQVKAQIRAEFANNPLPS